MKKRVSNQIRRECRMLWGEKYPPWAYRRVKEVYNAAPHNEKSVRSAVLTVNLEISARNTAKRRHGPKVRRIKGGPKK